MHDKLSIPKTITVGYQNRQGTYTGKLAYVVYTDTKGVVRKQSSWDNWRDHKIDPQTFDNVPTSGFVLNKKVGDYRGGWHGRRAWIRIYDPRNFEFEISVENLLFILEETSAIKGKGLEGEFVYSWSGSDLVLLPTSSLDYKASSEFTELQTKKVGKADMQEGCLYRNKDNQQVMYLGRHDWYEMSHDYGYGGNNTRTKQMVGSKQHIFVSVDGKSTYWTQSGFTKLAERLSAEPSPLFADEFEKFKKSVHGSQPKSLVARPAVLTNSWGEFFQKKKDKYYQVSFSSYGNNDVQYDCARAPVEVTTEGKVIIPRPQSSYYNRDKMSKEEFSALDKYLLFIENSEGNLIQI